MFRLLFFAVALAGCIGQPLEFEHEFVAGDCQRAGNTVSDMEVVGATSFLFSTPSAQDVERGRVLLQSLASVQAVSGRVVVPSQVEVVFCATGRPRASIRNVLSAPFRAMIGDDLLPESATAVHVGHEYGHLILHATSRARSSRYDAAFAVTDASPEGTPRTPLEEAYLNVYRPHQELFADAVVVFGLNQPSALSASLGGPAPGDPSIHARDFAATHRSDGFWSTDHEFGAPIRSYLWRAHVQLSRLGRDARAELLDTLANALIADVESRVAGNQVVFSSYEFTQGLVPRLQSSPLFNGVPIPEGEPLPPSPTEPGPLPPPSPGR